MEKFLLNSQISYAELNEAKEDFIDWYYYNHGIDSCFSLNLLYDTNKIDKWLKDKQYSDLVDIMHSKDISDLINQLNCPLLSNFNMQVVINTVRVRFLNELVIRKGKRDYLQQQILAEKQYESYIVKQNIIKMASEPELEPSTSIVWEWM